MFFYIRSHVLAPSFLDGPRLQGSFLLPPGFCLQVWAWTLPKLKEVVSDESADDAAPQSIYSRLAWVYRKRFPWNLTARYPSRKSKLILIIRVLSMYILYN